MTFSSTVVLIHHTGVTQGGFILTKLMSVPLLTNVSVSLTARWPSVYSTVVLIHHTDVTQVSTELMSAPPSTSSLISFCKINVHIKSSSRLRQICFIF